MNARVTQLEEQLAHLARTVEDLSGVIARQDREIDQLQHRTQMLMEREAQRELDTGDGGGGAETEQKPPHW